MTFRILSLYRKQFDDDVRDLIKVKIIHGFWKNTDERRIALLV
jgi:tyrosyl-DNA phosphodiesterase-1